MSHIQGKKILLVDDDPDVLQLLVHTFSLADAQVLIANCGEEALRQFYIHRPDLIVLDVKMPDIDGWQVCLQVCELSDVPIIFLTALDGAQEIINGLDCGAVDYVTKPFSPEVLIARAQAGRTADAVVCVGRDRCPALGVDARTAHGQQATGRDLSEVIDHGVMKSIYFTDNNGIALEASCWVVDATGRPLDADDTAVFADTNPVQAVKELAAGELTLGEPTSLV